MTDATAREANRRWIPRTEHLGRAGLAFLVLVVAALVIVPIGILVDLGFQSGTVIGHTHFTLDNYSNLFDDPHTWTGLKNTVIFTAGSALFAIVVGTSMAFLIACVDVPGRAVLRLLPVCVMILPPLVKDPAMAILFTRKTGLVNMFLHGTIGLSDTTFNVFSMTGMIFVAGLFAAPLAYIIMLAPFEGVDRSFLEASQTLGAPLLRSLFRVILPTILPALLSAVTLIVIVIASGFETPMIIGLPAGINTYMSNLYQSVSSPSSGLNFAAAQGSIYLLLTVSMVGLYLAATRNERKYVSISGRGHERMNIHAPVLRWCLLAFTYGYVVLAFLGPLLVTIMTSIIPFYSAVRGNPFHDYTLENYRDVFRTPDLSGAIKNSSILAVATSLGVVVVTLILAVTSLKGKSRFRRIGELIAMAPIAVPGLVYSVGLLLTVLSIPGLAPHIYGSRITMLVAMIVVFLPIAMRLLASAVIQVSDELIEASMLSGAGFVRSVGKVLLPILKPAILYTAAVVIILSYRELGAVVFLVAPNVNVVAYASFTAWVTGGYPILAALNMITLLIPLVFVAMLFVLARTKPIAAVRSLRRSKADDLASSPLGDPREHLFNDDRDHVHAG